MMHQLHLNTDPLALLILIALWLIPGIIAFFLARSCGRNPWKWWPACTLAPVLLFALVALPSLKNPDD